MGLFGSIKQFAMATGKDRSSSVLGIDIGTYSIKIVELEDTKEGIKLNAYGEFIFDTSIQRGGTQLNQMDSQGVAGSLKELMIATGTTTMNCGIAIPFASSLATVISVPPLDDEKLTGLIPLEARKYIPVPVNEVYLDWQRIRLSSSDTSGESSATQQDKVLLFAIHKNAVSSYQSVIKNLSLDSSVYEMEIFSTLRSSGQEGLDACIIADIGASHTRLCVVRESQILATRKISKGGRDLTEDIMTTFHIEYGEAESLKKNSTLQLEARGVFDQKVTSFYSGVADEIVKLSSAYEKEWGNPISAVIACGGSSEIEGFQTFIKETTKLPCGKIKPFSDFSLRDESVQMSDISGSQFAVATGIALRKISFRE
jgi:type IV pilus assembly protein PilM